MLLQIAQLEIYNVVLAILLGFIQPRPSGKRINDREEVVLG